MSGPHIAMLFIVVLLIGAAVAAFYEPLPKPWRPSAFAIEHRL